MTIRHELAFALSRSESSIRLSDCPGTLARARETRELLSALTEAPVLGP
jgi:hypothetical protein